MKFLVKIKRIESFIEPKSRSGKLLIIKLKSDF